MSHKFRCCGGIAAGILALAASVTPAIGVSGRLGVTYAGSTSQGDPIVISLSRDGKRLARVVNQWEAPCRVESPFTLGATLKPNFRMSPTHRFVGTSTAGERNSVGTLWVISEAIEGRVNRLSVAGSMRVAVTVYDKAGKQIDACGARVTFKAASARGSVFGGATSQDFPVAIELARGKKVVHHLHIGWHARCTPPGELEIGDIITGLTIKAGHFGRGWIEIYEAPGGLTDSVSYSLHGTIRGSRASGQLRVRVVSRNAAGAAVGQCDSGTVSWSTTSG